MLDPRRRRASRISLTTPTDTQARLAPGRVRSPGLRRPGGPANRPQSGFPLWTRRSEFRVRRSRAGTEVARRANSPRGEFRVVAVGPRGSGDRNFALQFQQADPTPARTSDRSRGRSAARSRVKAGFRADRELDLDARQHSRIPEGDPTRAPLLSRWGQLRCRPTGVHSGPFALCAPWGVSSGFGVLRAGRGAQPVNSPRGELEASAFSRLDRGVPCG